jgi:hypothetical protein
LVDVEGEQVRLAHLRQSALVDGLQPLIDARQGLQVAPTDGAEPDQPDRRSDPADGQTPREP